MLLQYSLITIQIDLNLAQSQRRGCVTKILSISEAKMKLAELVAGLAAGEEEVIITRNGRPAAILMAPEAYEALQETLSILSDPEAVEQIRRAQAYFATGQRGLSLDEVFPA
jgi:prevent-host-death family protein